MENNKRKTKASKRHSVQLRYIMSLVQLIKKKNFNIGLIASYIQPFFV